MTVPLRHNRKLHVLAVICLCLPIGTCTSFAISAISAVKDEVQRSELIKQTAILNRELSVLRDHLRTVRQHANIAKTTLDVLQGKRSISSVFHFTDITGYQPQHLIWNLQGLYSDLVYMQPSQLSGIYGHLLPAYDRVINDYQEFREDVQTMSHAERAKQIEQLEAKDIDNQATIIIQSEKLAESVGQQVREEINELALTIQQDGDELGTNDLLKIIAATNLINARINSHHLLLYATVENKHAEAKILERKISHALDFATVSPAGSP